MITKEEFTKLITDFKEWDTQLDKVGEVLGVCPLQMDWVEYGARLFDTTIELLFKTEAVNDINWWLFEKPILKMYGEESNSIETIEDLWNIVKDYRK